MRYLLPSFTCFFAAVAAISLAGYFSKSPVHVTTKRGPVETIYVRNFAPKEIPNRIILHDIPAWEAAANGAFSRAWGTPQVRIKLVKKVPLGAVSAYFVARGHIKGALAYHTVVGGVPHIVVYAGTDNYYGFNNSVSFTHELFEMLADNTTSRLDYGYPEPVIWVGSTPHILTDTVAWVSEVCDPVERYAYLIGNVHISDWVTQNWFNDGVAGGMDHMGVVSQPLQILKGGYAQFFDGTYHAIVNFRGAGKDANGFLIAERSNNE